MANPIEANPLGNIALSALLAILVKAGPQDCALRPRKGWPDFAGMPESSWRRGLKDLTDWELVSVDSGAGVIGREFYFNSEDGRDRFVQVPSLILWPYFTPLQRRVYLACLTLADFHTGSGRAGVRLIARCCGRGRSPVARALSRLRGQPIADTERCVLEGQGRAWRIYTRPKGSTYGRLPFHVLETFGFDFSPPPKATRPQHRGQTTATEGTHTLSTTIHHDPESRSSTSRSSEREDEDGLPGGDDDASPAAHRVMPWVALGFVDSPVGRSHWLAWQDWHGLHRPDMTEEESAAYFRRERNLASHGDDDARE